MHAWYSVLRWAHVCRVPIGAYNPICYMPGSRPCIRPTEQRFWDDLLYNSTKWGLFMYEQDWLDTEYDNVACGQL